MRIPYCPHCQYDLTGLPPRGTCPECGQTYDAWRKHGPEPRGESSTQRGARLVRAVIAGILAAIGLLLICLGAYMRYWHDYSNAFAVGGMIGLAFLLGAAIVYVGRNE